MTGTGLFVPAGSGASPILKPFVQPVKAPVEGPAYIIVPITIPAGATQGAAEVNPSASGMSQVASVVINSTDVPAPQTVSINSSFFWRVGANGSLTAPAYWSGGITYLSATLDAPLAVPVTLQIALFNIEQTPSSTISALEVSQSGTWNMGATIQNASIAVTQSGTWNTNATITNASIDVVQSGTWNINANITNASIDVVQSGAWTVDISNASINVAGSVNANITNATIVNTPNNYPVYPNNLNQTTIAVTQNPGGWTEVLAAQPGLFSAILSAYIGNPGVIKISLTNEMTDYTQVFILNPGDWIETCNPTYQGAFWASNNVASQTNYLKITTF